MKQFTITVYLNNGEKDHSDFMTEAEVIKMIPQLKAKKLTYGIYDHINNKDADYKFRNN